MTIIYTKDKSKEHAAKTFFLVSTEYIKEKKQKRKRRSSYKWQGKASSIAQDMDVSDDGELSRDLA